MIRFWDRNKLILRDDYPQKFTHEDLEELDTFLKNADAVIPLREVQAGQVSPSTIAMRHDVDHDPAHALKFARWEAERGYRSTYFLLHSAWYWHYEAQETAHELVSLGHEVGFHLDGIGVALERTLGKPETSPASLDPQMIFSLLDQAVGVVRSHPQMVFSLLDQATEIVRLHLQEMRSWGIEVVGSCKHGSPFCKAYGIQNEELWNHISLSSMGLLYEAYFLHRELTAIYLSDNRGVWREGDDYTDGIPPREWVWPFTEQAHLLVHPCHWRIP